MAADGAGVDRRPLEAADLFCGAGGLSTGATRAVRELGMRMRLAAVNHWPVAVQTHQRNHPEAAHHCVDLEHVKPRDVVPGGRLDLLMAAPACTFHSHARGSRPVNDQQRMDPWHVVRWATDLRVARLLVENVPEFMDWGPCSLTTGRPIPSRRGEYFRAWCEALRGCGFRLDWRVLNCADYGDPTTRQRFFAIGRSDRKALRWPEPSHAKGGATDLLSTRLPWRAAAEVIDWADLGRSIFNRDRPLADNTLRRILAGAIRYHWPKPHVAAVRALLDRVAPTLTLPPDAFTSGELASLVMATGNGGAARSTAEPLPTITAGGDGGARPHFVTPLLAPYYGGGSGLTCKPVTEPLDTVTTKTRFGLATPFLVPNFSERPGQEPRTHSILDPLPTIAAGGHIQLARPVVTGYSLDVLYRSLKWRELARAMSFDDAGEVYEFTGSGTEITKQIGNAVPGRTAKALVRALMEG